MSETVRYNLFRNDHIKTREYLLKLQEMILNGYRISEDPSRANRHYLNHGGIGCRINLIVPAQPTEDSVKNEAPVAKEVEEDSVEDTSDELPADEDAWKEALASAEELGLKVGNIKKLETLQAKIAEALAASE